MRFSMVGEHLPSELWFRPEVQEQSDFDIGRSEVIQKLGLVLRREARSGFVFDDDQPVDDEVGEVFAHFDALEVDLERNLLSDREARLLQRELQTILVHLLKEAVPQQVVNV